MSFSLRPTNTYLCCAIVLAVYDAAAAILQLLCQSINQSINQSKHVCSLQCHMSPVNETHITTIPVVFIDFYRSFPFYKQGSFMTRVLSAASAAHCGALWRTRRVLHLYVLSTVPLGISLPPYCTRTQRFNFRSVVLPETSLHKKTLRSDHPAFITILFGRLWPLASSMFPLQLRVLRLGSLTRSITYNGRD